MAHVDAVQPSPGGGETALLQEGPAVGGFSVRAATESDSDALLRLTDAPYAPRRGVRWAVRRSDDFFVRLRAEAGGWHVVLAEEHGIGAPVGCASVAIRDAWVDGAPRRTAYVSNLFVPPAFRRRGVGDLLCRRVTELCRHEVGPEGPVLMAVKAGNRFMARRLRGPRGLPPLHPFARVAIHSLRTRRLARSAPTPGLDIGPARAVDLEDMSVLARRVFPNRQFGPVIDAASLEHWIQDTPGLSVSDFLVAREGGPVVGWFGVWDESVARRLTIAGLGPAARVRHRLREAVVGLTRGERLPGPGDEVGCAVAVQVCVPPERPDVLRALLVHAGHRLAQEGCLWLRIALDPRDSLGRSLRRVTAASARFSVRVATASGNAVLMARSDTPVHFEAGLV